MSLPFSRLRLNGPAFYFDQRKRYDLMKLAYNEQKGMFLHLKKKCITFKNPVDNHRFCEAS